QHALSGGVAGVVSRFIIAPLDVIKIHLQLQTGAQTYPITGSATAGYEGVASFVTRTLRQEGVRGLWRGNLSAEYLYLSYGAIQFLAYSQYERLLTKVTRDRVKIPAQASPFIAGFLTGVTATAVTYPFDLLRTRFAAQDANKVYTGLTSAIIQIYRTEGIVGFYRGVWPSLIQIMPYVSLVFGTYDLL
ncbi:mitochondrial carrier domain-containing protein, partial [Dimargaris cristalligena]